MNYLAHGFRFLDRPHFLAGTAVPDWLSAVDRRARIKQPDLERLAETQELRDDSREIVRGILQHLRDDDAFHSSPALAELSQETALRFRRILSGNCRRTPFLGHVAVEMLLDAVLIERTPGLLDRYYDGLSEAPLAQVVTTVRKLVVVASRELEEWIAAFCRVRFLEDYRTSCGLLARLNQVVQRVKLSPLPPECVQVFDEGRRAVEARIDELLPTPA